LAFLEHMWCPFELLYLQLKQQQETFASYFYMFKRRTILLYAP
jgi:hypothetical protein